MRPAVAPRIGTAGHRFIYLRGVVMITVFLVVFLFFVIAFLFHAIYNFDWSDKK